jgi:hypothetical protein
MKYGEIPFPKAAVVCGWMIAAAALLILPIAALHSIWTRKSGTFGEVIV